MSVTKVQLVGNVSTGASFAGIVTATDVTVGLTTITGSTGNIITPGSVTTGNLQSSSINNGPLAGFRNAIINGNFDIWQRGTSFTGLEYGADRWVNNVTGSACTMSRQAFTLGQTDVPGEPTYFCRMAVTSVAGANHFSTLQHRIEDVRTFAGQQVTISFWAKADTSRTIAVEHVQNFGGGGSPSVTTIGTVKKTLTTSWQKITNTFTVPSISGKTIGTASFLSLNIWFDAGSDFNARTDTLGQQSGTFDIAQVQVEAGPVATPFERRPIGTELALCQRYYERLVFGGDGYLPGPGVVRGGVATFSVRKRGGPSIFFTALNFSNSSGATPQALGEPQTGFIHFATVPAAGNFFYDGIAIADAEL